MKYSLKRRDLLAAVAASPLLAAQFSAAAQEAASLGIRQGRLKQSVMASVWGNIDLNFEQRCEVLSRLGFSAMDLPNPNQIGMLRDYGLAPSLMTGTGTTFENGLIRRELHDQIEEATRAGIDMCVEAGCPNLIALPGERRGMSREEGKEHAIEILSRVAPYAEEKGINVCMEITNSKVAADNRTDQVFDDLNWGLDVCKGTGSSRIKLVYDIYHVQIANGDVVRNMRDNLDYVCHIHVAGVPTREEIFDETQELSHRFIARAIAESGYEGYVAHEWRPAVGNNPLLSLARCFEIMVV